MNPDIARAFLERHQVADRGTITRRGLLKAGAAGAAVAATASLASPAAAATGAMQRAPAPRRYGPASGSYSDDMFDVEAVLAGAWSEGPYGAGDERGSFNELTPERTSEAIKLLKRGQPVNTYNLGEEMFNGFPAFPSDPPRLHNMHLYALGFELGDEFTAGGGIIAGTEPIGPNQVSIFEERFEENFTFQIGTQVDGLNHIGVGDQMYNGFQGPEIAAPLGTTALGNENMGPVTTRGVIYDVVGLKVATGQTDTFFTAPNGRPVLNIDYRVTLDDLRACLERQRVAEIGAGEVPIIRTGWTHLVRADPATYLSGEPGIYLEEARYFADRRVALVATDTWGLEVLDPAVTGGNAFPVHQVLLVQHGVRIGESFVTDAACDDHAYEGLLVVTPENVPGATCGSSAPAFMAQPGTAPK